MSITRCLCHSLAQMACFFLHLRIEVLLLGPKIGLVSGSLHKIYHFFRQCFFCKHSRIASTEMTALGLYTIFTKIRIKYSITCQKRKTALSFFGSWRKYSFFLLFASFAQCTFDTLRFLPLGVKKLK